MRRPKYFLNSILGVVVAASERHEQLEFSLHVVAYQRARSRSRIE